MYFKNYEHAAKEAHKLIKKLSDNAKKNPSKFHEYYGENEVNKFHERVNEMDNLTYQQKCKISEILWQVYDIEPY